MGLTSAQANRHLLARLEIPSFISGNDDFTRLSADFRTAMAEDDTLIRDPPHDQKTSLGRTHMLKRHIASAIPVWSGPVAAPGSRSPMDVQMPFG